MSCSRPVVGSVVTLQFRFFVLDVASGKLVRVPSSPDTVDVAVEKPGGAVINPVALEVVMGLWEALVPVDEPGLWRFTVASSGTPTVADNGSFAVVPQAVAIP
jgi:hypothetical protein